MDQDAKKKKRALAARCNLLDRAILRALHQESMRQGSAMLLYGVRELASAVNAPERTVKRALARLRADGYLLPVRRRQRGTAIITMTPRAQELAMTIAPLTATSPPGGDPPSLPPEGFLGDAEALRIAMIRARMRAPEPAPVDIAYYYLEHASNPEIERLDRIREADGTFPFATELTRNPLLDEGLRQNAINQLRRVRWKRTQLAGLATFKRDDE
jgi:DNA-binding Lrp family transcriptional regulator